MKWAILIPAMMLAFLTCPAALAHLPAPGHDYLYVWNANDKTVSVIDTLNDTVVKTIDIGSAIKGMAADPTGYYVYLACGDGVRIIDTQTDTVRFTGVGSNPYAIAASPDGSGYYVLYGTYIDLVRTGSDDVARKIDIGRNKDVMAISPNGKTACLASSYYTLVGIYDMPAGVTSMPEVDFGTVTDAAFSPDSSYAYVSLKDKSTIMALELQPQFLKFNIPVNVNTEGIAVSRDGTTLYAAAPSGNAVLAINTSSRSAAGTIPVGNSPQRVLFGSDGTRAYVTNANSNSVSVINCSDLPGGVGSTVKNISVGNHPAYMALVSRPISSAPTLAPIPTPTPEPTSTPMPLVPKSTPTLAPTPTPIPTGTPTPMPKSTPTPTPGADALVALACFSLAGAYAMRK